jgi:hypothetical protein
LSSNHCGWMPRGCIWGSGRAAFVCLGRPCLGPRHGVSGLARLSKKVNEAQCSIHVGLCSKSSRAVGGPWCWRRSSRLKNRDIRRFASPAGNPKRGSRSPQPAARWAFVGVDVPPGRCRYPVNIAQQSIFLRAGLQPRVVQGMFDQVEEFGSAGADRGGV